MLRPRALARRVAQRPHSFPAFSDNSRKNTHQTKSVTFRSPCHCELLFAFFLRRIQAPFQAISGKIRQYIRHEAISGRIQAFSSKIRPFSGIFSQNQAESGKIRQNRAAHWIWKISGQGSYAVPISTNCSPFLGRAFLGAFHQTKAQANHNQTASNGIIHPRDMATVLTSPRYCHNSLNPIKMSACARKHCARKHCGRNMFLPTASPHGHPVVAEDKV